MTAPLMPLDHAYEALDEALRLFRNECMRDGIKTLSAREWRDRFRSFLDAEDFDRRYVETLRDLARFEGDAT